MSSQIGGNQPQLARWTHCLILVLVAGAALFVLSPAEAGAAGTGTISGTLTDSSADPLADECVEVYDSVGDRTDSVRANAQGKYTTRGLAPGNYRIKFLGCKYDLAPEFYEDAATLAQATPVSVTADSETAGIDAELAKGGSISGTVTDSSDDPLEGICAFVYDSDGVSLDWASTDSAGEYTIDGLATGDYRLRFRGCSKTYPVAPEFYDDQPTLALAVPVAVTASVDTPDIDAQLAPGGSISGTVANSSGDPLERVNVVVYDSTGEVEKSVSTDSDGNYTVFGLASADYRLEFVVRGSSPYNYNVLDEFYGGEQALALATPIAVTAGVETPDIDVQLATGGSISGTVTSFFDAPTGAYCFLVVSAYDSSGVFVGETVFSGSGNYRIERLKTGDYRVRFGVACITGDPEIGIPVTTGDSEYYRNKETLAEATPVSVVAGSDTPDIDGVVSGPDGSISGTVVDSMGEPLENICVKAFGPNGSNAGSATSGANGRYKVLGVEAGDYQVKFEACSDSGINVLPEYYDDALVASEATLVSVAADSSTTGIDAQLAVGGSISGTVTNSTGDPLNDICVTAYDSDSAEVRYERTDSNGNYMLGGLSTGDFRLKFSDCVFFHDQTLVSEFYDNVKTVGEATPIPVTAGSDTPGIDADLAKKTDGPVTPPVETPEPPVDTPARKASISKVSVKGPARVGKGRKATYRVRVTNSGNARANGVRLRVRGRGVGFRTSVGRIPAGTTRTIKVTLKPKKSGKAKLTFKLSSANAGAKSVKRRITVRN